MKNLRFLIMGICAVFTVTGCSTAEHSNSQRTNTVNNIGALVVGVADGKVAGPCPGSDLDARNFDILCAEKNIKTTVLINNHATYSSVKRKLSQLCKTYDTAIFYFSGHGGQTLELNPYVNPEPDHKDEFLCLYDLAMRDNDIWQIISKAKGRVICIFDCCHSATMYRAPMFTDKIRFGAPIVTNFVDAVNTGGMFILSGSPDDRYSYGSTAGGQLTNAIRKHYKDKTYAELFELLENDKKLRSYQRPICTLINGFNADVEFLK